MTQYIDLLVMTNMSVDYTLLALTARLRSLQVQRWRWVFAALLGSFYVGLHVFYPSATWMTAAIVKIAFSFILVRIAYRYDGFRHFLYNVLAFYAVSFMLAGCLYGGLSLFGIQTISKTSFFVAFVLAIFLILTIEKSLRHQLRVQAQIGSILIVLDDVTIRCRAFVDTGNHLQDPFTNKPVSLTQLDVWHDVLPQNLFATIGNGTVHAASQIVFCDSFRWANRVLLIPCRTVGKQQSEMLFALRVDRLHLIFEHEKPRIIERAIIAINPTKMRHDNRYDAIIHPAHLQS